MAERPRRVLLVDPDPAVGEALRRDLPSERFEVWAFSRSTEAMQTLLTREVEVVVAADQLDDRGGLAWLIDARTADPLTSLVLLVPEQRPIHVAADGLNRAGIVKLLTKPWDPTLLAAEFDEAAVLYERDTRSKRNTALSAAQVKRLAESYDHMRVELGQLRQQNRDLRRELAGGPSAGVDQAHDGDVPQITAVARLCFEVCRGGVPELVAHAERVAQVAQGCAEGLGWPPEECDSVRHAALLHHLLLPTYADEYMVELRGTGSVHAERMGELLGAVPGMDAVAAIVAAHHERWQPGGVDIDIPRGARLLQSLSLFDELLHDPQVCGSRAARDDPTFPLARATEIVVSLAGTRLEPKLTRACMVDLIPWLLGRREQMIPVQALREGMVLTRSLRIGDAVLLPRGAAVTRAHLAQLDSLGPQTTLPDLWVEPMESAFDLVPMGSANDITAG